MQSQKILYWVIALGVIVLAGAFIANKKVTPSGTGANVDEIRKEILDESKDVRGVIKEVSLSVGSGTTMTIEVEVPDISHLGARGGIPVLRKTIEVFVDNGVLIEGTNSPQVGDIAIVTLDKSVYDDTRFHAVKILVYNYANEIKRQVTEVHLIRGQVKSLSGNTFVLNVRVPDVTKINTVDFTGSFVVPQVEKNYTVTIADTTYFTLGTANDLKVGKTVRAWGEDLLTKDSFTASKILIE